MTILTATRASTQRPSAGVGLSMALHKAWGTLELSNKMAPGDTFIMCKLPKGAVIVGGALLGDALDSAGAGTACLTLNIGVDKSIITPSGVTYTYLSTSNCLAAAWALGSEIAAVPAYKPEATGRNIPLGSLLLTEGPLTCTDECNAYITAITSASTTFTGTLTLTVDYYASTVS